MSTVRLTMPAKAEYLVLARLALSGIARQTPADEAIVADLKLAVTEACTNAVRHAYASDGGVVRIVIEATAEAIEICVEDDGSGLAFGEPADGWRFPDEPVESGMGLAVIRAVVDELEIARARDDRGTVVRMRKRFG